MVKLIEEIGTTAVEQNYFAALMEIDPDELHGMAIDLAEVELGLVGARVGSGFNPTSELHLMTYDQALASPDAEAWKVEIENKHDQMTKHKVWKAVPKSSIPKGTKLMDSTWTMKKKSNGKLRVRLNVRGFKQIDGEHYDSLSIASPVMNNASVRILMTLMIMANWSAKVVNIKGAFFMELLKMVESYI